MTAITRHFRVYREAKGALIGTELACEACPLSKGAQNGTV